MTCIRAEAFFAASANVTSRLRLHAVFPLGVLSLGDGVWLLAIEGAYFADKFLTSA